MVLALSLGCGGKKPEPNTPVEASKSGVDSYALFAAGAIGMGSLDVQALFRSGKTGESLGQLISNYSPLGPESGFSIESNVDRVTCASYQLETADVLCVAEGRFDAERLDKAAAEIEAKAKGDPATAGKLPAVVRTPYAGRTLITAANIGFVVFDSTHLLAGTENAMRRALDRVRDGVVPARAMSDSFQRRVAEAKTDLAFAVTLEGHSLGRLSFGPVKVRLLQGLKEVYGTGTFTKKLVDAGTVTPAGTAPAPETHADVTLVANLVYVDEARAAAEKEEAESLLGFARLGASTGFLPRLAHQAVTADGSETRIVLGFKDSVLAGWLGEAPSKLGLPRPTRSSGATGTVPGAD